MNDQLFRFLPSIFISVFLNGAAQLFLRKGLLGIEFFVPKDFSDIFVFINGLMNFYFISGVFCFAFSFLSWIYVLSKVEVTVAYPFSSLAYVIVLLGGLFLFGESVSFEKVFGVLLICIGVIFVAKF